MPSQEPQNETVLARAVRLDIWVRIGCRFCKFGRLIAPSDIPALVKGYERPNAIDRLVCSECGERQADVHLLDEWVPEHVDIVMWRNADAEGRKALRSESIAIKRGQKPDPRNVRRETNVTFRKRG